VRGARHAISGRDVTRLSRLSASSSFAVVVAVLVGACSRTVPQEQMNPLAAVPDASSGAAAPHAVREPPDAGRADLRAFCTDVYNADNARQAQKCAPKDLAVSQGMARAAANLCADDVNSAFVHGRVSFDADAAKHCVQMLQDTPLSRTSDSDTFFAHYPCDSVLLGQQTEGQACRFSVECKEGLACEGYAIGVDGVCKKPPKVGETCIIQRFGNILNVTAVEPHHPACVAGAWCDGSKCQPRVAAGKACGGSASCTPGLSCVMGKCGNPGATGATCTATGDCAFGSWCDHSASGAPAAPGKCAETRPVGAQCPSNDACKGRCDMTDAVDAGAFRFGHCGDVCGSG
jgi:hypothetical protein